jgi:hypothetical protein
VPSKPWLPLTDPAHFEASYASDPCKRARARSTIRLVQSPRQRGRLRAARALIMSGGGADCMTWRFDDRSPEAADLSSAQQRVVVIRQERRGWQ